MNSGAISSAGLASGMDTNKVVSELMKVESTKMDGLKKQKSGLQTKEDAWRKLNTSLYALKDTTADLQDWKLFKSTAAGVSNENVATAVSSEGAQVGSTPVNVTQLAKAQSVTSDSQRSSDKALRMKGQFKVNGKSITVSAKDTLSDIASKINDAAADSVSASVVQDSPNSFKLVVVGQKTGKGNDIDLDDVHGNVLQSLGVIAGMFRQTAKNVTQVSQNAIVSINGAHIESTTNTIDKAISGVTLTLNQEGDTTVKVTRDTDAIIKKVKEFVDNYNAAMKYLNEQTAYSKDGTSGILFGDSTISYMKSTLKSFVSQTVSNTDPSVSSLVMVGISTEPGVDGAIGGMLKFDQDALKKELESHYKDVDTLFGATGDNGVFSGMYKRLDEWCNSTGTVQRQIKSIDTEKSQMDDRIDDMQDYLDNVQDRYYKQFSHMEDTLSKLQTQSSMANSILAGR